MKIAIDILHISYWNFYKNIIAILEEKGCEVYIFVRKRGALLNVIKNEYSKHKNIVVTGNYYSGRKKVILHLLRIPVLLYYIIKYKIDVVSSDGFFIGVASKILLKPAVMHSDDYEYRFSYKMTQLFSSVMVIPDVFPITSKKDFLYRGCKENAYLGKINFVPDKAIINNIFGEHVKYVFIRLVSKTSLNYIRSTDKIHIVYAIIDSLNKKGVKVIISSEEKHIPQSKNCYVLNPPVMHFHSILYFAQIAITEGDTMAREAAILRTPVIYLGERRMKVHNYFRQGGYFLESTNLKIINPFIERCLKMEAVKKNIRYNFENINEIMVEKIISIK